MDGIGGGGGKESNSKSHEWLGECVDVRMGMWWMNDWAGEKCG